MSLSWISIDTALPRHPKVYALNAALGIERSWTFLVELWLWAATTCPDGDLSSIPDNVIAQCAGWRDDASRFVSALMSSGFLDNDRRLHNWHSRQLRRVEKHREAVARYDEKRRQEREARRISDNQKTVSRQSSDPPTDIQTYKQTNTHTEARAREHVIFKQDEVRLAQAPPKPGRQAGWQVDKPRTPEDLLATPIGEELKRKFPMLDGKGERPELRNIVGTLWDSYARWQWPHQCKDNLLTYVGRYASQHRISYERDMKAPAAAVGVTVQSDEAARTKAKLREREEAMKREGWDT